MVGQLYMIPTPVGNLEDITLRSLRMLKECDIILAEDTRVTQKLLKHFCIEKPIFSYHKENEYIQTLRWIKEIQNGKKICMVTDAGTPGISDPGYLLVQSCLENNIEPEVLPGPTAFVPALVKSGLPCHAFTFLGFIPHKKGRKKFLLKLNDTTHTVIFYESMHRITKLAEEMKSLLHPSMRVCFAKEISKIHETFIRGILHQACDTLLRSNHKGEWVVVVSPTQHKNNFL